MISISSVQKLKKKLRTAEQGCLCQERRIQQKEESLDKRKTIISNAKTRRLIRKLNPLKKNSPKLGLSKKSDGYPWKDFRIYQGTAKDYILSMLENDLVHEKSCQGFSLWTTNQRRLSGKTELYFLAIAKCALREQVSERLVLGSFLCQMTEMKGRIIGHWRP